MKRVLIAGTHSGCGKTTVTCAILAALKARGLNVQAFKCGPDYIDPMFHREVTGVPCHNLDSFFCGDDTLRYLLYKNAKDCDIAVIEGVMGFYDGTDGRGSAHSVSMLTDTPAVIVINCRGMSDSIGAVMKGFLDFKRPNSIAGFIFDMLPERLIPLAKGLCERLGTLCLGCFPKSEITIESRHLGLVTASEIPDIREKLSRLGELAERYITLDTILALTEKEIPQFTPPDFTLSAGNTGGSGPVIAVARDSAFCFIYADNIDLLRRLGCKIRYFSPLYDEHIPGDADGLLLCGGYPELHADKLSANVSMLGEIRAAVESGLPTIAECGGFMYLHDTFEDADGHEHRGAAVIHAKAYKTGNLRRFGYVTLTSRKDGLLCSSGGSFPAHEFHYYDSTDCGADMNASKSDGRNWDCVHTNRTLYAGFPHLYYYADTSIAERFVNACREHGKEKPK